MKIENKDENGYIWILVHTKSREENKAAENLELQGFETFLPLIPSTNRSNDQIKLVPVFPRYLFTKINPDQGNWTVVNSTLGVSKIVMFSDKFTPVSNDIVDAIKERLHSSDVFREGVSIEEYEKGDNLSITRGQLTGIDAIFLSNKSKDRVRLLLKLLNTSVVAEVDREIIGHKEIIKKFKF